MLSFILGFVAGAVVVELIPLDKKMQAKAAFITQWQKFTKKG